MVYLLNMVIFHGKLLNNQRVDGGAWLKVMKSGDLTNNSDTFEFDHQKHWFFIMKHRVCLEMEDAVYP